MLNLRFVVVLIALICLFQVMQDCEGRVVKRDAATSDPNAFQDFMDEASKKMKELMNQLKETADHNKLKEQIGKAMDSVKTSFSNSS